MSMIDFISFSEVKDLFLVCPSVAIVETESVDIKEADERRSGIAVTDQMRCGFNPSYTSNCKEKYEW